MTLKRGKTSFFNVSHSWGPNKGFFTILQLVRVPSLFGFEKCIGDPVRRGPVFISLLTSMNCRNLVNSRALKCQNIQNLTSRASSFCRVRLLLCVLSKREKEDSSSLSPTVALTAKVSGLLLSGWSWNGDVKRNPRIWKSLKENIQNRLLLQCISIKKCLSQDSNKVFLVVWAFAISEQ